MMHIRWRIHEKILVTLVALYILVIYVFRIYSIPEWQKTELYAKPFSENGEPFNYFRHILLLQVVILLLQYVCYLWLNHTATRFINNRNKNRSPWIKATIHIGLIACLLGPVSHFIFYIVSRYSSHPGILISPFKIYPAPASAFLVGMGASSLATIIFIVYVFCREWMIRRFETANGSKSYRVAVVNGITTFIIGYLCLFPLVHFFGTPALPGQHLSAITSIYAIILPSIILFGALCIYYIFPNRSPNGKFTLSSLVILVPLCAVCALPATLLEREWEHSAFLVICMVLLLIVAPLSWLIFLQRRDRLLQLIGVKHQLDKSKADMALLRSQVHPHFLFNALNTLYGTAIREKSADTAHGIQILGDMMRYMIKESQAPTIPLKTEIDYLKNYITFQRLRIPQSVNVQIDQEIADDNIANVVIEPMVLIPFVENAFKHGISFTQPSWVKIVFHYKEHCLHFQVSNSCHPGVKTDDSSGIGLQNVRDRLQWKYPRSHQLIIDSTEVEFNVNLKISQV